MDPDIDENGQILSLCCCAEPERALDKIERSSIFLYDPEFTAQRRLSKLTKEKIVEVLRDDPAFNKLPHDWQKLKVDKDAAMKTAAKSKKPLPKKANAKKRKSRCR
eukprot:5338457-Pleurochrysis_carterae.AAC.1